MKSEHLIEIALTSDVAPAPTETVKMSRRQRLERWADVLERHPGIVTAPVGIEYLPQDERRATRGNESPMAVAFGDPVLRNEGLGSDRLGDVMDFFELTDREAHRSLCDCHYHGTMTAKGVASRLRALATERERSGRWI